MISRYVLIMVASLAQPFTDASITVSKWYAFSDKVPPAYSYPISLAPTENFCASYAMTEGSNIYCYSLDKECEHWNGIIPWNNQFQPRNNDEWICKKRGEL